MQAGRGKVPRPALSTEARALHPAARACSIATSVCDDGTALWMWHMMSRIGWRGSSPAAAAAVVSGIARAGSSSSRATHAAPTSAPKLGAPCRAATSLGACGLAHS